MPVSDAKKRANAKWSKVHMKNLACTVTNDEHAAFKKYAEDHGKTISGMLLEYVRKCISDNN